MIIHTNTNRIACILYPCVFIFVQIDSYYFQQRLVIHIPWLHILSTRYIATI